MKFTQKQVNDLLNLIDHARTDISYDEGGTYGTAEDTLDKKAIASSERAIEFIKTLILERD